MCRSQGIFPLPVSGAERKPQARLTRAGRRRQGEDLQLDEVSRCLNALSSSRAGCALRPHAHCGDISATVLQRRVLEELSSQLRTLGRPEPSAGALAALLKSHDSYNVAREVPRRPYDAAKVRVLREGTVPKPLLESELLHGIQREVAADPLKHILKSDEEMSEIREGDFVKPYTDPLLRSRASLLELVRKLHVHHLITFRRVARAKVGVFTVVKKDESLRLIFDCRETNLLCRPPPTSEMATAAALA